MNVPVSIGLADFTVNVQEDATLNYGKLAQTVITAYREQPLWRGQPAAATEAYHQIFSPWSRFGKLCYRQVYQIRVFLVIFCGVTSLKMLWVGVK